MFDDVWKTTIQVPKGKVGFWKPKEDIRSVQRDNDKDCCEEAKNRYKVMFMTGEAKYLTQKEMLDKEKIDEYDKSWAGIGGYDCNGAFRKAMEKRKSWPLAMEVLKFWDECEGK